MDFDPSKLERILRLTPVQLSDNVKGSLEFSKPLFGIHPTEGVLYVHESFSSLKKFDEREPQEAESMLTMEVGDGARISVDGSGNVHLIREEYEVGVFHNGRYHSLNTFKDRVDFVAGATIGDVTTTYVATNDSKIYSVTDKFAQQFADVEEQIQDMVVGNDNRLYVMTEGRKLLVYDISGELKEPMEPTEIVNLDRGEDGPFTEDQDNFRIYLGASGTVYVSGGNRLGILKRERGVSDRITSIWELQFVLDDDIEGVVETLAGRLLVLSEAAIWDCFLNEDNDYVVRGLKLFDQWHTDEEGEVIRAHEIALSKTFPSRLYVGAGEKEVFAFDIHWDYAIPEEDIKKLT